MGSDVGNDVGNDTNSDAGSDMSNDMDITMGDEDIRKSSPVNSGGEEVVVVLDGRDKGGERGRQGDEAHANAQKVTARQNDEAKISETPSKLAVKDPFDRGRRVKKADARIKQSLRAGECPRYIWILSDKTLPQTGTDASSAESTLYDAGNSAATSLFEDANPR
ncbi:hypothetical protein M409DRAFT_29510 [Zasmidium cellare ATCC 36951]|uniref:Uncharacterized protein n=1 Tax=Zasmidium cellare ATCC 36951 TaxID=1080233 RepID=A0A6A6C2I0_ZASCE|nr:uncharacterized protein M409DRAFT_29510 [Zasmidium cellare ATCC 36951]KAF2160062.1 hypothetical protein M409DRAFT_29510 [Zasmidium cellare ATCC 36951]